MSEKQDEERRANGRPIIIVPTEIKRSIDEYPSSPVAVSVAVAESHLVTQTDVNISKHISLRHF